MNVRWKDASGNLKEERAITSDVGRSGMYMICDSPIEEGCEINLEIDLAVCSGAGIKSRVSVGGKVVRNIPPTGRDRGYGHAVLFDQYRFVRS